MPSIDDFINHRWTDAKTALRELDPDFVGEFETSVRLEPSGLYVPRSLDIESKPVRGLSTQWHRLLESCYELIIQTDIVQTSADSLIADSNNGAMSAVEIGRRILYHFRSWCIHAKTLADLTCDVIRNTTDLYVTDRVLRAEMIKRHCDLVYHEVTKEIGEPRNDFVHPNRSMSKEITQGNNWEVLVASSRGSLTERIQFGLAGVGNSLNSETDSSSVDALPSQENFAPAAARILDSLGSILRELEEGIAGQFSPKT